MTAIWFVPTILVALGAFVAWLQVRAVEREAARLRATAIRVRSLSTEVAALRAASLRTAASTTQVADTIGPRPAQ